MSAEFCAHQAIQLGVSGYGRQAGFQRLSNEQLAIASTQHGQLKKTRTDGVRAGDANEFPAPLVLPNDLLALDPEEAQDRQSFRSWLHLEERNEVEPNRKTLYVVPPPKIDSSVKFIADWSKPSNISNNKNNVGEATWAKSASGDYLAKGVLEYLSAYYHGMPAKLYKGRMKLTQHATAAGKNASKKSKTPDRLDMVFGDGLLLDVRTRACPDGTFLRQLNMNDLIDVLINMLPDDAYAMMMIVDHDVYESDDDDFLCGRAWGGSRVSVVSSARYNPALDDAIGLDGEHVWPASHCKEYVDKCINEAPNAARESNRPSKKAKVATHAAAATAGGAGRSGGGVLGNNRDTAGSASASAPPASIRLAVSSYQKCWKQTRSSSADRPASTVLARRWLARVCKTASHELGHCFGMDHCSYYACIMQGTAGLHEDARQPPYLCPVDLAKVLHATTIEAAGGNGDGGNNDDGDKKDSKGRVARYRALLRLCEKTGWKEEPMFAAYAAWLRGLLALAPNGSSDDKVGTTPEIIVLD